MNSVITVKKEIEELRQRVCPKPEERVILHMWLPSDDPRHKKTDDQIIEEGFKTNRKIIVLPNREGC